MDINEILRKKGMTKYRLSVLSGVPHATLNNICSGGEHINRVGKPFYERNLA